MWSFVHTLLASNIFRSGNATMLRRLCETLIQTYSKVKRNTPLAALHMIGASACCWQTGVRSGSKQASPLWPDAAFHSHHFVHKLLSLAMGPLDSAMTGTLETLADLREDGRRRFIKRRTKEELEEIVVAILQEQDEEKNEEGRGKWLKCIAIQRY